ncbi:uncharacterized protein [Montipora foliosa]|uniref:uncharacterized protein n=1 Tax=Montipora foliosa TaxID=591990 RepID=UPI0035F19EAF
MTPQEVRTSILHAFQAQGHLRTVTDCSQFDFLNCDEVNKRKLVQLDPPSQNPTATTLKSLWRSQCPIYIRPHFSLRNTTQAMPSSTSLRASPGFLFRQNIQSLLGQSLPNQNEATNIVSAIHRDTPTRNASAAYTTTTITNTSNTLTRNAGTHVHMENTGHIPAAGTNTSSSMNSGNSHTTSTTPTPNTNTIVTSTTITVNARHTHTTNTGSTAPPHALLTTTAPAESSNHSIQTQVEGTAIAASVDANNDRDILFPSWDLNIDTLGGLNDSPNRRADLISLSSPTGSSHSMESIHSYSSIHSSRGSANQDLNEEDSMDGSRVAVQVLEDVVALPSSVVVEDSQVGSINEHLNQHSSQILSAFTDVAPEMFYAWQNEVYGWQHPNIITMPLELLCHQAAADMTTVLLYFSDNNACDIFRDDFCRNILSNPDFIEACNNVYF